MFGINLFRTNLFRINLFHFNLVRHVKIAATVMFVYFVTSFVLTVNADTYSNFLGMEFVTVPAGSFKMGAASEKMDVKFDELPQHKVDISSFQFMTTETTLAMYKQYIVESSSVKIVTDDFMNANSHGNDAPVVFVSWNDVRKFLHWLNKNKPKSDTGTYRLPTEAEWEYACRAGKNDLYCGSNTASEVAWYSSKSIVYQQPVAKKKPNAFGLYDMSGNAREWVSDCYHADYVNAPSDGRTWSEGCQSKKRLLRGGSWNEEKAGSRVTDRIAVRVSSHSPTIGFRAVRETP